MVVPDKIARMVKEDDAVMLSKTLKKVRLPNADGELIFAQHLLNLAHTFKSDECIRAIFDYFADLDEEGNLDKVQYTTSTRIIISNLMTIDTLEYVVGESSLTFQDVFVDVVTNNAGPSITPILNKAAYLFRRDLNAETLRELQSLSVSKENYIAEGVARHLLRRYTVWSARPDYIVGKSNMTTNQLAESKLANLTQSDVENPDDSVAMRSIIRKKLETMMGIKMGNSREDRRTFNAAVSALMSTTGPKDQAELRQFLNMDPSSVVSVQEEQSPDLFRVLGPLNKFLASTESENNPDGRCGKYGCRMLTCMCFPDIDEEFEEDDEFGYDRGEEDNSTAWFKGVCMTCDTRIPRACYAVRRPVQSGGWKNTYCSFQCLERDTGEDKLTLVEESIVRIAREQLVSIGVYDREDDNIHPYPNVEDDDLIESDSEL